MGTKRRKIRKVVKHLERSRIQYPRNLIRQYKRALQRRDGTEFPLQSYTKLLDHLFKSLYEPGLKSQTSYRSLVPTSPLP